MGTFSTPFKASEHRNEHQTGDYADDPIIPKGYYPCLLIDTKEADNESWFLYKWQITGGPAKGTKVSVFENPTHPEGGEKSELAGRIFRGRLANYCDSVGLDVVEDESQLLNRPVKAYFKPWVRKDGTQVNQVSHYKPIGDNSATLSTAKPFYPKANAPSKSQVAAQNEFYEAAADAEDDPFAGIGSDGDIEDNF